MANLGLNGALYRGTAGAAAATLMTNVQDLSFPDERSEAEISTRGCSIELFKAAMRKFSLEWSMTVSDSDADFTAIQAAYLAGTPIALKCISKTNGSGIDADFVITKFSQTQPLKEAQKVEVTAKPTYDGTTPRYPAAVSATTGS
jgi:hypothetical protein